MSCRYIVLCGGVGGSKLADGLAQSLAPDDLAIIANTADDFDHLGLRICPDIDTITYMLAGLVNPVAGWGRSDETWSCMEALRSLDSETWFQLGDKDIGLHLHRSEALRRGVSLSEISARIGAALGLRHRIVPMTEAPVRTMLETPGGLLEFQDYFVRRRCEPVVSHVEYRGIAEAQPACGLLEALDSPRLEGIFIAPSNPILSIGPILAIPGVEARIRTRGVPVIAISPLIAGASVKGPAAKLMAEMGHEAGNAGIAACYAPILSALMIHSSDAPAASSLRVPWHSTDTLMKIAEDRQRLALEAISFLREVRA